MTSAPLMPNEMDCVAAVPFSNREHATPINDIAAVRLVGMARYGGHAWTIRLSEETAVMIAATKEFWYHWKSFREGLAGNLSYGLRYREIGSDTDIQPTIEFCDLPLGVVELHGTDALGRPLMGRIRGL